MYRVEKNERSLEAEMEEQPTRANPMSDALKPNSSSTSDADEALTCDVDAPFDVDALVRGGFIRKVYGILTVQLIFTFGLVFLLAAYPPMKHWVRAPASCPSLREALHADPAVYAPWDTVDAFLGGEPTAGQPTAADPGVNMALLLSNQTKKVAANLATAKKYYKDNYGGNPWTEGDVSMWKCQQYEQSQTCSAMKASWSCGHVMYWTAYIVSIITFIAIACCGNNARIYPRNFILLFVFTLAESLFVGVFAAYCNVSDVVTALGITIGISGGLTGWAMYTKKDFTSHQSYIFAAGWAFMLFSIVFCFGGFVNKLLYQFFCFLGILMFALYLVYDTQLIVGGKHKSYQFTVDDYVFAALMLYIDIINMFIYILALLNSGGD